MSTAELISQIQSTAAKKELFDKYYGKLAAISQRYCKSQLQADEILNTAFGNCLIKLQDPRKPKPADVDAFIEKEFITECVSFIRGIRSEYYVSSTVYAVESPTKNYDLFESNEIIDFNRVENEILIRSLQQLVPSQRLIFNLHVIDGFGLSEAALLLESSEETVKSNLEKARFNLQKNIEKHLKTQKS